MWGRDVSQQSLIGKLAEAVRFELTDPCGSPVFKTGAIDHSATLPDRRMIVSSGALGGLATHLEYLTPAAVDPHRRERAAPDAAGVERQKLGLVDQAQR